MRYKIQTPGELEYKKLNKPVYYSPAFLASLAKKVQMSIDGEGHNTPKIADALEILWQDGALWIETDKELDMNGYGFSTVIDNTTLVEQKDRYIATKGQLTGIARTNDPKDFSTILYNSNEDEDTLTIITLENDDKDSDEDNNGDDSMTDEINDLNEQIGSYKTQLNAKQQEIDNLKQSDATKEQELEDIKNKKTELETQLQTYKQQEQEKAEKIAEELAGDDEDLLNVYKEMPLEKLQVLKSKQEDQQQNNDTGFQGAGDDTTGDDQNNGSDDDDKDKPEFETYEDYAKARGGW